jgi:ATP-binding cassette subfamily B protein
MFQNLRRLMRYYRGYRRRLFLSQLLLLGSVVMTLTIQTLNTTLINDGVQKSNLHVVIDVALWMLLCAFAGGVCSVGNAILAVFFSEGTAHVARSQLYRRVQGFSFGNIDRFRTSDLLVRLTTDVNNVKLAVQQAIMMLLQAPLLLVAALALAFIVTPQLAWIMLVVLPAVGILLVVYLVVVRKDFKVRQQRLDDVNNVLEENLSGMRVVKAFVRQAYENARFGRAALALRDAGLK